MLHDEALEKLKYYCSYQERSHSEVRSKLLELKVYGNTLETIITELIAEDFLNEERFACALARGKFLQKKWGRNKIIQALKLHQVSSYCIKKAMQEIDTNEYLHILETLAEKKWDTLQSEKNKYTKQTKLKNYLLQKGYEMEYIMEVVIKLIPLK